MVVVDREPASQLVGREIPHLTIRCSASADQIREVVERVSEAILEVDPAEGADLLRAETWAMDSRKPVRAVVLSR